MLTRRTFLNTTLGATCASLIGAPSAWAGPPAGAGRKKMAIIGTEFRMQSHMQHMGDRFLTGYPLNGAWHPPGLEVVSRQSNLVVESTNAVPEARLRQMLIDEVKKQSKPYGLYFRDITGGYFGIFVRSTSFAALMKSLV